MARTMASIFGDSDPRLAIYPGAISTDTQDVFEAKVRDSLTDQILAEFAKDSAQGEYVDAAAPATGDVVFSGNLDEVQEFFIAQGFSDGLPIIPPTLERVHAFLAQTDRDPAEVIGVLAPEDRELTIWTIAVNAVMAGCRPEYMPLLAAIGDCLVDPEFRLVDLTSTFGMEPLVIVSGPIVERFDFNSGTGAMRVGRQANSTVGRFVRLVLRNVAGLRIPPGETDASAIGMATMVAMAEDGASTSDIGWTPFRVDNGFSADVSTVSLLLTVAQSPPIYSAGETALDHLETIARVLGNTIGPWAYTATVHHGFNPVILMSPNVARALQQFGYGKAEIRQYLYDNLWIKASITEGYARQVGRSVFSFDSVVQDPELRKIYVASDDPDRLVPQLMNPEWTSIVIGGNPGRNQSKVYIGNLTAGPPVTRVVELPPA